MPELNEREVADDPITQFRDWFQTAQNAGLPEPNAMTVATATPDGIPSARMVLLRGYDQRGFVFFTNYESRKGSELQSNRRAALVFFWAELHRQIRVEGRVERVTKEESEAYFAQRARGHQLGAWASAQSSVIPDRQTLVRQEEEVTRRFEGQDVPLPPYWGGYRVIPRTVEFWQGQLNRLHDRLVYRAQPDGTWKLERLSP